MGRILLIFIVLLMNNSLFSQEIEHSTISATKLKPKLFLYASDLPITLQSSESIIRKHIIDQTLSHQGYDLMFSQIPNYLVKGKQKQFVLKYKIRTDGQFTYRLELFLFDIDNVVQIRYGKLDKIHIHHFVEILRATIQRFLLNQPLSNKEIENSLKTSRKRVKQIKSIISPKINVPPPPLTAVNLAKIIRTKIVISNLKKVLKKDILATNTPSQKSKKSIWELIRDTDKDIPWKSNKGKKTKSNSEEDPNKKSLSEEFAPLFDPSSFKPLTNNSNTLEYNRFHISYKFAQRELQIEDYISISTKYHSILGFGLDWLRYYPMHISKFIFLLKTEFDTPLTTTPVQLEGHFNFHLSTGYRFKNQYMIAANLDIDRLNFPNLNNIGETISSNSYTIYWGELQLGYFNPKFNYAFSIGVPILTKNSGEDQEIESRATGELTGYTTVAKFRYYTDQFFKDKFRFWMGMQYRRSDVKRQNKISNTEIISQNIIAHFGVYF